MRSGGDGGTAAAGARAAIRFGIKGRLIGAFAVVTGLAIAACAVSYHSSGIDTSFGQLSSRSLPQLSAAIGLARDVGDITAVASAMAAADVKSPDEAAAAFRRDHQAMVERVEALAESGVDAKGSAGLHAGAGELAKTADALLGAKRGRFALRDERAGIMRRRSSPMPRSPNCWRRWWTAPPSTSKRASPRCPKPPARRSPERSRR